MVGKKGNKKNVLVVVLICIAVLLVVFSFNSRTEKFISEKRIYSVLEVSNKTGFAVNDTALIFGRLSPGTRSDKDITVVNNYSFSVNVYFSSTGNISSFLVYPESIYLDSGESKQVKIGTVRIDENVSFGTYTGDLILTFKKAKG